METMRDTAMTKEVRALMRMAINWRKGYEKHWIHPFTNNEFVYEEFADEIATFLRPYLVRLVETEYASKSDANAIAGFFYDQIEYLRQRVREMEQEILDQIYKPVAYWSF